MGHLNLMPLELTVDGESGEGTREELEEDPLPICEEEGEER